jgi:transcriptional regulator with XRE-family HTH domain
MSENERLLQVSRLRRQRRRVSPALGRALRLEARVTLAEVAEAIDVSVGALSRWETGKRQPRGVAAERYAALLARLEAELRK